MPSNQKPRRSALTHCKQSRISSWSDTISQWTIIKLSKPSYLKQSLTKLACSGNLLEHFTMVSSIRFKHSQQNINFLLFHVASIVLTVLTTIGYGHSTPSTVGGKMFTMYVELFYTTIFPFFVNRFSLF